MSQILVLAEHSLFEALLDSGFMSSAIIGASSYLRPVSSEKIDDNLVCILGLCAMER